MTFVIDHSFIYVCIYPTIDEINYLLTDIHSQWTPFLELIDADSEI